MITFTCHPCKQAFTVHNWLEAEKAHALHECSHPVNIFQHTETAVKYVFALLASEKARVRGVWFEDQPFTGTVVGFEKDTITIDLDEPLWHPYRTDQRDPQNSVYVSTIQLDADVEIHRDYEIKLWRLT